MGLIKRKRNLGGRSIRRSNVVRLNRRNRSDKRFMFLEILVCGGREQTHWQRVSSVRKDELFGRGKSGLSYHCSW